MEIGGTSEVMGRSSSQKWAKKMRIISQMATTNECRSRWLRAPDLNLRWQLLIQVPRRLFTQSLLASIRSRGLTGLLVAPERMVQTAGLEPAFPLSRSRFSYQFGVCRHLVTRHGEPWFCIAGI